MSIFTRACFIIFYIGCIAPAPAQEAGHIRVRRDDHALCFFQEGIPSDTISINSHDLFYLNVPLPLRCGTRIEVSNGMLLKTATDGTFQLKRIISMNYIHFYDTQAAQAKLHPASKGETCMDFITAANGVPAGYTPHLLTIRFYNASKDSLLLSNAFYYK